MSVVTKKREYSEQEERAMVAYLNWLTTPEYKKPEHPLDKHIPVRGIVDLILVYAYQTPMLNVNKLYGGLCASNVHSMSALVRLELEVQYKEVVERKQSCKPFRDCTKRCNCHRGVTFSLDEREEWDLMERDNMHSRYLSDARLVWAVKKGHETREDVAEELQITLQDLDRKVHRSQGR